jgi:ADP-dependent NAD(P)H-hydrate dehydratase / NAD(P)H-hydrate epimerase
MIPIVTPQEMGTIDAAAPEPLDVLVGRAGAAVARSARQILGGTYGRVVNVVAGKGNNGADGRVAGELLAAAGVTVRVFEAADNQRSLPPADLVIDAAYGTGFHGDWEAPQVGGARVLAVDIPSGVDGLTGVAVPGTLPATTTVTFAALKPGHLLGDGKRLAGDVIVVDIGLDVSSARAHVVERADVGGWWRPRPADAHKWTRAVRVVAGSPGMTGAASLAAVAAMRAGAGIVWLSTPGETSPRAELVEVVGRPCPASGWGDDVASELPRFGALVIGPGLGLDPATAADVRVTVSAAPCPVVVDGDGLTAIATSPGGLVPVLASRRQPTVLTPHDREFERLTGSRPAADRIDAVRRLAATTGAVILLKGPTTIVADPDGWVRAVTTGDQRLATAGTGDVLSGTIGALLGSGLPAFDAAAAAAWLHGTAAALHPAAGLVASDVAAALPRAIEMLA